MYRFFHVLFCLLVFCVTGFSQHSISGKATNQEQKPLVEVHIHIGSKTVSSDWNGRFSVKNLPTGKTKVHVSHVGFHSIDTVLSLVDDLYLDFILKPKIDILNEVVVKHVESNVTKSILEHKIKRETIEIYSNQSLGDVLREVAGVSSLKTGSTVVKPIINGLYGSRVPILNNNVRLEDQQWGTEHAPNFDINAAGKISVIKGASGLQYGGDAVGGLVLIEPLVSKKDTLFGKSILNFDSNGRGGSLSSSLHRGNLQGLSWNLLGTFKYMGDRETPNFVLSNSGNRESNVTADIKFAGKNYDISSFYSLYNATIGILRASHIGSAADLFNAIKTKIPDVVKNFTYSIANPKQEVQHQIAKLSSNYFFNESAILSMQYAFQFNKRLEYDIRREKYENTPALDLSLTTHSMLLDYKKILHDWDFKTGFSGVFQKNSASPRTGVRPLIPNYTKFDTGVYGVVTHRFSETFSMDSGLRLDYCAINAAKYYYKSRWEERGYESDFGKFVVGESGIQWLVKPKFEFLNVSASLGFQKEFENHLKWFTNISLASRNPNPSEFFSDGLHHSTGMIELGDLGLKREQYLKISTAFQKKIAGFYLDVNPYLNRVSNYMFLKPTGFETTIRGTFPVWEYQQTDALLAGIVVESHWNWNQRWTQNLALSYINGQDSSQNEPLIDMPPLNLNSKIQFSNSNWHDLLLSLKTEMIFRQNRFPNNNFETDIVVNGNLEKRTVDISTPPAAYQLLHFYSEVKFKTFKKGSATLVFSIQNLANTRYRDYLNRQRFFADEMGRNLQIQLKLNY